MSLKEHFNASLFLVDKLVRRGDHADAITVLVPWAESALGDFEKTIVAYNLAQVFSQMGQEIEALAWFDWGIDIERGLQRTLVAEGKAVYLAGQGRRDEAVELWKQLLGSGWLDAKGRGNVEANLRAVHG